MGMHRWWVGTSCYAGGLPGLSIIFLRVPGGHKHWSGGDKKLGALFYEESSGKFDLVPAK
jgi:hypothetical protein